jgi:4-amino-4-deoxy-L-arabinose transferase-like glycosyltransferase
MKVFGINEWAARFPNVLSAFATFLLLYRIGTRHIAPMAGWIMVLVYAGSLTPHLYFRSGIIDPVFNLFMLLAIYQLYLSSLEANTRNNRHIHFLLAGLFTGLAVLTKGPVGLLIVGLSALVYYIVERFRGFPGMGELFSALLAFSLVVSVWFVPEWIRHGNWFMEKFIAYQLDLFKGNMEAHAQPFWYHIPVLLLGCFPASILALINFRIDTARNRETNLMHRWMQAVFWVVLIVFSLSKTKIVHYSSMCWFPLSFQRENRYAASRHQNHAALPEPAARCRNGGLALAGIKPQSPRPGASFYPRSICCGEFAQRGRMARLGMDQRSDLAIVELWHCLNGVV